MTEQSSVFFAYFINNTAQGKMQISILNIMSINSDSS